MDGITFKILKYGGETVVEWMDVSDVTLHGDREVPDEWKKVFIVHLHKGKSSKDECNNYKRISLHNVPGKVYGRVLTERLMEVT